MTFVTFFLIEGKLIFQIINLSNTEVFRKYSEYYKIFREVYEIHLLGLELRDIPHKLAENVQKIILQEKEICYKIKKDKNYIDLLVTGSVKNFRDLSRKILAGGDKDLGYQISNIIKKFNDYDHVSYSFGDRTFNFENSHVMGILNVTEDSFSDGGRYISPDKAVSHAIEMIDAGACIIDVGGESTRPGAEEISADKEIERIIPVINNVLKERPGTIISADTTKSKVAAEALSAGAKIINDISGFNFDPEIVQVVKKYKAGYVLMHMKGKPADMQKNPYYDNVVKEIYDFLFEKSRLLLNVGIKKIFIDPGIGFGKKVQDNFELLKRIEDFKCLGFPILIGVSRKSFIGKSLDLEIGNRDMPTAILEAVSIRNGAKVIRTHNVNNGVQVCKLLSNINKLNV